MYLGIAMLISYAPFFYWMLYEWRRQLKELETRRWVT
jgi:hypothetical protein